MIIFNAWSFSWGDFSHHAFSAVCDWADLLHDVSWYNLINLQKQEVATGALVWALFVQSGSSPSLSRLASWSKLCMWPKTFNLHETFECAYFKSTVSGQSKQVRCACAMQSRWNQWTMEVTAPGISCELYRSLALNEFWTSKLWCEAYRFIYLSMNESLIRQQVWKMVLVVSGLCTT